MYFCNKSPEETMKWEKDSKKWSHFCSRGKFRASKNLTGRSYWYSDVRDLFQQTIKKLFHEISSKLLLTQVICMTAYSVFGGLQNGSSCMHSPVKLQTTWVDRERQRGVRWKTELGWRRTMKLIDTLDNESVA